MNTATTDRDRITGSKPTRWARQLLVGAWPMSATALLLGAAVLVGTLRFATLSTLALTDNTEARYADISWQMSRSGDWVTPQVRIEGELKPFWAKPPLFFWMTATSFRAWGASEWSARLPNFLVAIGLVAVTVAFGRRLWGPRAGALAGLILASSGLYFVLAGTCVLDMVLTASVCLAMMSFALFAREQGGREAWWGRAFFFALGLGCLAKGPVAVALVGLAVAAWIIVAGQWALLRRLPWLSGALVTAVVAGPWYFAAEHATPGFLRYFIVNEHILRYIRRDYGDLYGDGRVQPYGASWVMLVVTFLPWTPIAIRCGFDRWRNRHDASAAPRDTWLLYALIWGLTPAVFFTFCRQILVTYMLPGFAGLALATAVIVDRQLDSSDGRKLLSGLRAFCTVLGLLIAGAVIAELVVATATWKTLAAVVPVAFFAAVAWRGHRRSDSSTLVAAIGIGSPVLVALCIVAVAPRVNEAFSTKTILFSVANSGREQGRPVFLLINDEYSADFYQEAFLGGRIDRRPRNASLFPNGPNIGPPDDVYVIRRKQESELDAALRSHLTPIAETPHWIAFGVRHPERISRTSVRSAAAALAN